MRKILQGFMAFAVTMCLCMAALGEAGKNDGQDAEVRFGIQLTAALNNDRQAQYLVAEMYEQGVGTPQNLRMAHLWYTKSAKQGYAPAVEKLDNWEKARQESESLARERAEAQKRRQIEAEAAAATATAAKAAREETAAKAARERAEAQKRRQIEAEAAAATKATREETSTKAARERAVEEQKRLHAEAEAAAAAKAAREEAAKTTKTTEVPSVAKDSHSGQPKDKPKESAVKNAEKGSEEFRANPCKTPTAKFTSVCQ